MAATSPPVRVRRHSLMYENILIRQICELESPTDLNSSPIAAEAETTNITDAYNLETPEQGNGHLPNKLLERRLSTYKDKENELRSSADSNEKGVATRQLSAVGEVIVEEFNKFRNLESSRYFYFSEMNGFHKSNSMDEFMPLFERKNEHYWLNITQPSLKDFEHLIENYAVSELTVNDILEGCKQEKMEVFQHYTFISLKTIQENIDESKKPKLNFRSIAAHEYFNIILFRDFIITVHYKPWQNISDILGFLNLLSNSTPRNVLLQDWVLFSCFIEMRQDAKNRIELTKPDINQVRIECEERKSALDTSDIMRRNFDIELRVDAIATYIKPKMKILKEFGRHKYSRRLNSHTKVLCSDIYDDFEDLNNDLEHFIHVLERSQDTLLAFVREDHAREANEISAVMKRTSELALFFLPKNIVGLFFGMNVMVPFASSLYPTQVYFWVIILLAAIAGITLYSFRNRILNRA